MTTPTESDAELGMTWWNGLTERERAEWLRRADTAVPAEAWELFKRGADQPAVTWKTLHNQGDRWPNEWDLVLGYSEGEEKPYGLCLWYRHSSGAICWVWNGAVGYGVTSPTHWMPLPDPPKLTV